MTIQKNLLAEGYEFPIKDMKLRVRSGDDLVLRTSDVNASVILLVEGRTLEGLVETFENFGGTFPLPDEFM